VRVRTLAVPVLAAALVTANPTSASAAPSDEFPGFTAVDSFAQGQVATGYLFLVGDEEDRIMGANAVLNGPPAGSQAVAAFFQRGVAATYTYGILGGGSAGKNGALPEPPPGEAAAYFPAEPREATFEGPISTATGSASDGRFHAVATDTPSSAADAAATNVNFAGQFAFEYAHIASHTEPIAHGLVGESTSKIFNLQIGPLNIQQLVSHAVATITSKGRPTGSASTTAYGATVAGQGVAITEHGLVVAGQSAGSQEQVNAALKQAGLESISLLPTTVGPGEDGQLSIGAVTQGIRVVYRNDDLGAANPQGFAGGGFSMGGAEVRLLGNLSSYGSSAMSRTQVTPDTASANRSVTSPATAPGRVEHTVTPNRSAAATRDVSADLALTAASTSMTPQVASRLEKGYLAFGFTLLAVAGLAIAPRWRGRARR